MVSIQRESVFFVTDLKGTEGDYVPCLVSYDLQNSRRENVRVELLDAPYSLEYMDALDNAIAAFSDQIKQGTDAGFLTYKDDHIAATLESKLGIF